MAGKIERMSWTKLAEKLKVDVMTLKKDCKPIMRRLDKLSLKKNYRILWPKQIKIILAHVGFDKDEL